MHMVASEFCILPENTLICTMSWELTHAFPTTGNVKEHIFSPFFGLSSLAKILQNQCSVSCKELW